MVALMIWDTVDISILNPILPKTLGQLPMNASGIQTLQLPAVESQLHRIDSSKIDMLSCLARFSNNHCSYLDATHMEVV